jgi:glycosyltransferase involved in cell wall biosynthesis
MRILYDHQVFSLQDRGGISRYYFELLRQLSGLDFCSAEIFVGANRNIFRFSDLHQVKTWEYRGRFTMAPGKYRFILNESLANLILPFRGRFDVYHPTLYRYVPLARFRRMIVTHHDCTYERYPALFRNAESIKRMRARLFARADAIICPSASTRRDLHEFYEVPEEKTFAIHHGVTRLDLHEVSAPVADRPFLLYVGLRAPYKNFGGFLSAFAAAKLKRDFDILVLGGGAAKAHELALVNELTLLGCVRFVPDTSDELLARAYAHAHLLVYPSLYEGFGFPPLEAMMAGCPVLVAHTSALPEICGDAAFYFGPEDEGGFVDQLKLSCSNEAERLVKIERGRALANTYTWERCAFNTLRVYQGQAP